MLIRLREQACYVRRVVTLSIWQHVKFIQLWIFYCTKCIRPSGFWHTYQIKHSCPFDDNSMHLYTHIMHTCVIINAYLLYFCIGIKHSPTMNYDLQLANPTTRCIVQLISPISVMLKRTKQPLLTVKMFMHSWSLLKS